MLYLAVVTDPYVFLSNISLLINYKRDELLSYLMSMFNVLTVHHWLVHFVIILGRWTESAHLFIFMLLSRMMYIYIYIYIYIYGCGVSVSVAGLVTRLISPATLLVFRVLAYLTKMNKLALVKFYCRVIPLNLRLLVWYRKWMF